ncbi:MAG: acyl-CoA dehydrogenase family protein [Deltaproteobacteria bacterium]|nr:acyl-CoA dehydrogenase family protein [Deltaproteobacteria bacterium]MBW2372743.1 acyl-CoA dehydrogenase family protein [Deltaproteobacteria bacterium]
MIEWNEQHQMIREAMQRFVAEEIVPNLEALEHGDMPPYDILRKLYSSFGMDEMARSRFEKTLEKARKLEAGEITKEEARKREGGGGGDGAGLQLIPIIELCKYCPGMVTAMGVSVGLTSAAINGKGTVEQRERWALDLLTLDKIGAWAITEPGSGSDAFGGMKATARRDGDEFVLNGSKTFITNGPYADTIVFICKLEEDGVDPRDRKILHFVLDKGMPGLEQSKPLRKMGLHSSPTGEVFVNDVRAGMDRLLGGEKALAKTGKSGRAGAKDTFQMERSGVAAMALGIVERCLELSVDYSKERVQWDKPIGEYQLIQDKLARMEVARMNLQNLVFRTIELSAQGKTMTFAEASAMKLYSARAAVEVAMEAVQVFGGNGYMAEYHVEQLARDAKVLQIYAGTDEIQIRAIARELLTRS